MPGPWEDYAAPQDGPWNDFKDAPADTQGPLSSEPTSPLARAIGSFLESKKAPEAVNQLKTDLLTNEPIQGFGNNMVRGLPATVGGIAAGPIGAAALESARQGAVGINSAMGGTQAPSLVDALGRPVLAGVTQQAADLAAPYFGQALVGGTVKPSASPLLTAGTHQIPQEVGGALGAMGDAAKGTLRYLGINGAGVKSAAYDLAAQGSAMADKVRGYLGAEPLVGDSLAEQARGLISGVVEKGEKEYPALISAAKQNPAYAKATFNLDSALSDKATQIADKYGFIGSNRVPAAAGSGKFWEMADKATSLKDASLDEVYQLQKQLNSEAAVAYGSGNNTLGKAVGELQAEVKGYLGRMVPEIGQANASYAAAKALEKQTGKLTGNNDLLAHVGRIYKNGQDTLAKQALEDAAAKVPGLSDVLENINAYHAAKSFEPIVRGLPQTGMGAAALYGGGKAVQAGVGMLTQDPTVQAGALALGAVGAAAASPRLSLAALQASQAAGPALAGAARATAESVKASIPALAQAFSHMTPESISAFYKSP
jgi:hypothetical protein